MDDELRNRLEAWGAEPGPEVDPAFAQRLEADLRSAAYFTPKAGATPPPRRHPLLRPGFVLGALLLVALAAVVVVTNRDAGTEVLVIEDTAGATVTLPGEESMPATDGTELPDGTIIEVSPAGFAVIGDIVLPPDSRALIADGIVELVEIAVDATPTPTATPTPRAAIEPPAIDVTPEVEPTATPGSDPDPEPEPTPTTAPEVQPAPTERPAPTPTARPEATPEPRPTATPTPEPTPTVVPDPEVTLERTNLGPQRTRLTWTVTSPDAVIGFEVRVRRGDTIRTAAVLRRSNVRELVVERPERDRVFYRVLAIGEGGQIIARSNEVRVTNGENRPEATPTPEGASDG